MYALLVTFCSRALPDPPQSHPRSTFARRVIGERRGPINATLSERRALEGAYPGLILFLPAFVFRHHPWISYYGQAAKLS